MKNIKLLLILLLSYSFGVAQVSVTPKPKVNLARTGQFLFEKAPIFTVSENKVEIIEVAETFATEIGKITGLNTKVFIGNFKSKVGISFVYKKEPKLSKNGYFLDVSPQRIIVTAEKLAGFSQAIKILHQLIVVKVDEGVSSDYRKVSIPCCYIEN